MAIRKVVGGSVVAAGLAVAGLIGAGAASASPGISFDRGAGGPIGFGDNSETGAQASASEGNRALAISIRKPASASVDGEGTGNRVVAINGTATVNGDASGNRLVVVGDGSATANNDNNRILALGSNVDAKGEEAQRVVALCGKSIVSAQSDKVTVSAGACGATD